MITNIKNNYYSVIIPLYNKGDYIIRAIKSVLSQSYDKFEIIVVDDGSTDDSAYKVENIKNSSIEIIRQENKGVSMARNVGVQNSKYDYVVFLDADDTWQEEFLQELNSLINKFPNAGIYGVNNYFEYPNGKVLCEKYDCMFKDQISGIIKDYFALFSKFGKSPFCNSGCCFPKQVFNEVGGYKKGIKLTEDSDLWCRIAIQYDIAYTSKPLVTYFLETDGSTHYVFEPKDFEVSRTLQYALKSNIIKSTHVNSIKKLIAFQQLNLIKRAILSGHRLFAMKKLMDKNLFLNYPFNTVCFLFISIIPTKIILTFKCIKAKQI